MYLKIKNQPLKVALSIILKETWQMPWKKKIKWCVEAGAKNKISYEMKAGNAADQVVKACEDTHYDLAVVTTSHLDSWLSFVLAIPER